MEQDLIDKMNFSIRIFVENGNMEYPELFRLFVSEMGNDGLVSELFVFVPIAFCRKSLNTIHFPDYYYRMLGNKKEKYRFEDNVFYNHIVSYVDEIFTEDYIRENLISILSRSSEFDAINTALKSGVQWNDLNLIPPVIQF